MTGASGATLIVARCPLSKCDWYSEALRSHGAAREAQRAHISAHDHPDLVEHIYDGAAETHDVYEKKEDQP